MAEITQEAALSALKIVDAYDKSHPRSPRIFDPALLTDVHNARNLVEKYGQDIHYVAAWKALMHWNGKVWERLDEDKQGYPQLLKEWAKDIANSYREAADIIPNPTIADDYRKHAKRSESDAKIKAMLNLITGERGIMKSYKDFDNNSFLFACQNGTLNLLTNEFREHRREDGITKISPVIYDPLASCPRWIAFLTRIMRQHPEIIEYLQNFAGQCLTGEVREKSFYIFWGAGGDNGKTTFIEQIKYILNEYAQVIPIAALIKENKSAIPVDLHSLNGARFAFASEPDFGETLTDGLIKRITGRDTMKTRTLHEKPTEWRVQFKLAIATNHQPKIPDASGAMWGRVKCVPFVEKIPRDEQDKHLDEKLILEAPGILNWMIEGCKKWLASGMKEPEIVTQTVAEYRENSDKLADYFNYFFEPKYDGFVPFKIYYSLYKLWCANHEIRPVQEQTLPQLLAARGYTRGRSWYTNSKGESVRDRGSFGFILQNWLTGENNNVVTEYEGKQGDELNNNGQIMTPDSTGQRYIKDGRLVDRVSGQSIVIPVQLILETMDSDFEQAKWLCGQRDRENSVESILFVSCGNNVLPMSTMSSLSHDNDITISNSVHLINNSVHSVQNNIHSRIIKLLKESFDRYNYNQLLEVYKDIRRVKEYMELKIETEMSDLPDNIILERYTFDYFKARGWE